MKNKKIITGSKATTTDPADIKFQLAIHRSLRASDSKIIGLTVSLWVKTRV